MTAQRSPWNKVTLGDIATSIRNGLFARRPNDDGDGVRILRISAVRDGRVDLDAPRYVEGIAQSQIEKFAIDPGDLLLTRYNGSRQLVGIAGLVPSHAGPIVHPDKLIRVAINQEVADSRFVNLQMQAESVRRYIEPRIRTTAGQSGIAGGDVRGIPLVLPPLDEQRGIVEILEDLLSRLDAADGLLKRVLARIERMATAALWRTTHDHAEAATVRLTDVADVRLGRQRSPANHSGDRMRPYLRAANVDWNRLRLDDVKEMNFTAVEEATYRLEPNDILLTEASGSAAEVGKSVLYLGEPAAVCFQNTLLRVRCHSAEPAFVQKYLLAEARAGRFMPESRGVGINHLGRAKLAALEIRLPSASAQLAAAQQCEEALEQSERLAMVVGAQLKRSASLRRALLAAAFEGRLSGRPSDLDLDLAAKAAES